MPRLILTPDVMPFGLEAPREIAFLNFGHLFEARLTRGPLPASAELDSYIGPRSAERHQKHGSHWLDLVFPGCLHRLDLDKNLGMTELCDRFDRIELWIDRSVTDQLELICLLDYWKRRGYLPQNCYLHPVVNDLYALKGADILGLDLPSIPITSDHLDVASCAWQAFRSPTPQAWSALLDEDIDLLPQLRSAVSKFLTELPGPRSGLGATEMQMLKLLDGGRGAMHALINRVVYLGPVHERSVFDYYETADLLEAMAFAPRPVVSGVDSGLRTRRRENLRRQHELHYASRPVITPFGLDVLAGRDDYSHHNPILRWWGGTELTNANLWRWDPIANVLIAP